MLSIRSEPFRSRIINAETLLQSDTSISRYLPISFLVSIATFVHITWAFCLLSETCHRPESNKAISRSLLFEVKLLFTRYLLISPLTIKKKYELTSDISYASLYLCSNVLIYHRSYLVNEYLLIE